MLCGLFGLFESQSRSWRNRRKGKRIAQHTTYLKVRTCTIILIRTILKTLIIILKFFKVSFLNNYLQFEILQDTREQGSTSHDCRVAYF